jgi:hypothetical protein
VARGGADTGFILRHCIGNVGDSTVRFIRKLLRGWRVLTNKESALFLLCRKIAGQHPKIGSTQKHAHSSGG